MQMDAITDLPLPMEMLLKICEYLPKEDLFRVGQVSKNLNIAAKDTLRYKKMLLKPLRQN